MWSGYHHKTIMFCENDVGFSNINTQNLRTSKMAVEIPIIVMLFDRATFYHSQKLFCINISPFLKDIESCGNTNV